MENSVANMTDQQNQNINYASGDDDYEADVVMLSEIGNNSPDTKQGAQGTGAPDTTNPSGAAAQATFENQQQINKAIGQRIHAERQKYKGDIELSGKLRSLFPGMSDDEIANKLQSIAASDYAAQKDIPLPVAEEVLNLRMQNRQTAAPTAPNSHVTPEVQAIVDEAKSIENKYGINIAQMIVESPELQNRVFNQGVPLNDILIEHLRSQQPQKKVYAPAMSPNGAGSVQAHITDDEYKRIKEQLHQGKKVRI